MTCNADIWLINFVGKPSVLPVTYVKTNTAPSLTTYFMLVLKQSLVSTFINNWLSELWLWPMVAEIFHFLLVALFMNHRESSQQIRLSPTVGAVLFDYSFTILSLITLFLRADNSLLFFLDQ